MNQDLQEVTVLKLKNSWNLVIIVASFTVSLKIIIIITIIFKEIYTVVFSNLNSYRNSNGYFD